MLTQNATSIIFILISSFLSFYAIKSYIKFIRRKNINDDKTLYWGMGFVALSLAFIIRVVYTLCPNLAISKFFMYENLLVGISTWLHAYAVMLVSYKHKEFKKSKLNVVYWLLIIILIPLMTIIINKAIYVSILNISMIGLILYTLHRIRFKHFLFNGFLLMIIARILYLVKTINDMNGVISEIQLGFMTVGIFTIGISSYIIIRDRGDVND